MRFALVLLLWITGALPTVAQTLSARAPLPALVIRNDMGGRLDLRQAEIRQLRQSGRKVELRGRCYSACVMYLGLGNVCVSPGADFGFHGPQKMFGRMPRDLFDHWSEVMVRDLPPPLQSWFMAKARHVSRGVMILPGHSLIAMGYRRCDDGGSLPQIASAASGKP